MISGSLVQRYWVDTVATPGAAQPDVHREPHNTTGDRAQSERDDLAAGKPGGWQPDEWDQEIPVLDGGNFRAPESHIADGTHKGRSGRGDARPASDLDQPLERLQGGVHTPATLATAGSGGAEFGGLVRTGTMDPSSNPGGIDLGDDYRPQTLRRRQGLHFNAPALRPIRWPSRTAERDSPYPGGRTSPFNPAVPVAPGAGPSWPKLRRILRPVGQSSEAFGGIDQAPAAAVFLDPGPIGGDWVR